MDKEVEKSIVVTFRLQNNEKEELQKRAATNSMTVSDYIRSKVFDEEKK